MADRFSLPPRERFAFAHGVGIGFAIATGIVGAMRRDNSTVIARTLGALSMQDEIIEAIVAATERDIAHGEPSATRWEAIVREVIALLPAEMRRGLKLVPYREPPRG